MVSRFIQARVIFAGAFTDMWSQKKLLLSSLTMVCAIGFSSDCSAQDQEKRRPSDPPGQTEFKRPLIEVPMLRINGRPAVEGVVNGSRSLKLAIEWGGSISGISAPVAEELRLPIIGEVTLGGGKTVKIAKVGSIAVDGVVFRNLAVLVGATLDTSIDGFLGINLVPGLLMTLDYPASKVRFERGELPPPNGSDILPLAGKDQGGRPDIEIDVAGEKFEAVLDTRALQLAVLSEDTKNKFKLRQEAIRASATGPSLGTMEVESRQLMGSIRLGKYEFQDPTVEFRSHPNAIIGAALLENFTVTLDLKKGRVRLSRSQDGPIKGKTLYDSDFDRATVPERKPDGAQRGSALSEYVGEYGGRTISEQSGFLYVHRPGGQTLKLVQTEKDGFALELLVTARFIFERDSTGRVVALRVLNREGKWETDSRK